MVPNRAHNILTKIKLINTKIQINNTTINQIIILLNKIYKKGKTIL